jgi:signal transduction histidine kinase
MTDFLPESVRIERLQALTCALLEAETLSEVARVGLEGALPLLNGRQGAIFIPAAGGRHIELLHHVGYRESHVARFHQVSVEESNALLPALAEGRAYWFDTAEEFVREVPLLAGMVPARAWQPFAVLPLLVSGNNLGAVHLAFVEGDRVESRRLFITSIVQQLAVAMQRARMLERERRLHHEASFLSAASAAFGITLDQRATLESIVDLAVPEIGDGCSVDLLGPDGRLHDVVRRTPPGERTRISDEMRARYPSHVSYEALQVIAAGGSIFLPAVPPEFHRRNAVDEEHVRLIEALDVRSMVIVPLVSRGRAFGTFNLVRFEGRPPFDEEERVFVEEFARRAGLALENARHHETAEDAARVREEFLSIAAHELKTPLNSLGLHVQSLLQSAEKGEALSSEAVIRKLRTVRKQTQRIGALVEELLKLSRLSNGRLALDRRSLDLGALARDVAQRLSENSPRVPIHVSAEDGIIGDWDRDRLDQVLTNLIENGLKYGGGRPVDVRVRRCGTEAQVSVSDTGIGIDRASLERIFGRFERAVSERHYGGFGLGLWIARELVEAHGGTITVESEPGKGSTFCMRLPMPGAGEGK